MTVLPPRRFRKLYEHIVLSLPFALILGWLTTIALPALVYAGYDIFTKPDPGQKNALITSTVALILCHWLLDRVAGQFPGGRTRSLLITQTILIYGLAIITILLMRLDVSRVLLITSSVLAIIWFQIQHLITHAYFRPKLAIIPGGNSSDILNIPGVDARVLSDLTLNNVRYDGVVADFQSTTNSIEKFLADCALSGVPVYDANTTYESLTGKVKINRMSENNIGSLTPSPIYELTKTSIDILISVLLLPIILPLIVFLSIIIRIESSGSPFYSQLRVGKGNKEFKIFKLRTMYQEPNKPSEVFADKNDPRITKVGKWLRKTRADELPQLLNVLKGDMTLIGPRPEQPGFVAQFEKELAFYSYRHVIKPGITGWAQVRQGYAADSSSTQEKLEYDFYYIKHRSVALDLLIMILTIKTIMTGFGAR